MVSLGSQRTSRFATNLRARHAVGTLNFHGALRRRSQVQMRLRHAPHPLTPLSLNRSFQLDVRGPTVRGVQRPPGRAPANRSACIAAGMTYYTTVSKAKVAITLDSELIDRVDRLVKAARFPNRSQAIEIALAEKLDRLDRGRLARECAKLDPKEERALADEGLSADQESWPEY